jgi:carboxyl-terminal processing protease
VLETLVNPPEEQGRKTQLVVRALAPPVRDRNGVNEFVKAGLALTLAAFWVAAVTPALNGCSARGGGPGDLLSAVGFDPYRLSSDGDKEADRFDEAFRLYAADPDNTRQLKHFRDTYKRVHYAYIDDVPERKLIDAALTGIEERKPAPKSLPATELVEVALDSMTASLDPHSAYLTPEELRETQLVTMGEFGGLGIQVTEEEGVVKVIAPLDDTPAARAGIKSGDVITHLDGDSIHGRSLKDAVGLMRGPPGTSINLTIARQGRPPFQLNLTREIITIEPVRWRRYGSIGYIRIVGFNEKAAERLEDAMVDLRTNQPGLTGLVIDLRNNPGGLLDQSIEVADAFLDNGTIVAIKGRDAASQRAFSARYGDLARDLPIVVLVNAGSASAAEIVAGALQDQHRATLMGEPSFGKGSVQTVMRLPEGGALKLTTALYYTPNGTAIQARGVQPDIQLLGDADDGLPETHEKDLPGALAASVAEMVTAASSVDVTACATVDDAVEDRALGCAVAFLRAGSSDRFIASLAGQQRL